ncbi:MAG TPA: hypothetical protein VI278_03935 [Nitrososphaeraceae archaeon]
MNKEDFVRVVPGEIAPENPDSELRRLRQDLLLIDYSDQYFLDHVDGVAHVKRYLGPLVSKITDQLQNEKLIDKTEGRVEVKKFFKNLLNRLGEKTQDQIIDELISRAKEYGPIAILFLIKMIHTT